MSVILCTAGYDHTIRFWEALSGICSRTIQHPDSQVNRLCITPDKRYLAAAGRFSVKLYDIKSTNPNPVMIFEGHTGNITGVAFHCEGKWMVTSSEDGTVKVWDTRTGSVQRNYSHKSAVNDVVIHPNQGELIAGDRTGAIRIWDLGESVCTHQLIPEEASIASVSVASDGSLFCAGNNKGNVFIWRMIQDDNVTSVIPVVEFQAHKDYLTRVLLSPDVKHLATCSADHTAKVWSLDPLSSPPKVVTGENAGRSLVKRASIENSQNGIGLAPSTDGVQSPASASNSAILSSSGTATNGVPSEVIKTPSPELEVTLANHQRWVWDCAFSADSAYLVTVCSDHYARLWELATGNIIRQYSGHHRGAVCVALNDYSEPR